MSTKSIGQREEQSLVTVYCLPVLGILNRLFFNELLAVTVND
jgi:hypothetical protein